MAKSKVARFKKRRRNSDGESPAQARAGRVTEAVTDLGFTVGAGFAGYAVARVGGQLALRVAGKRYPKLARHIAVLGSAIGALGAWLGSRYWDKVANYHDAVTVGAGVGVAQSAVQTYLPKFAWLVSDYAIGQVSLPAPTGQRQVTTQADFSRILAENNLEEIPMTQPAQIAPPGEDPAPGSLSDDELENYNGMFS